MIGYLDCATGISGDKFLGACLDAGASLEAVRSAVASVAPEAEVRIGPALRGGISGLSVSVASHDGEPRSRNWSDIRTLIEGAALAPAVAAHALAAFALLAEAEARVHATDPERVHFHEVGAVDSIADIVGTAAALVDLKLTRLICSPVSVGSGTVTTAHGVLPVPAPATALLLEGVPIQEGPTVGEATTPTGAALVRVLASEFGPLPAMVLRTVGHGAGSRDTAPVANIARLLLGDSTASPIEGLAEEPVVELATTVDHVTPENLAACIERIVAAGALDAWQTAAYMKKGRLGAEVKVLAAPGDSTRLAALLAELTGTLGVRISPVTRLVVERTHHTVDTSLGPVRVKIAGHGRWCRARIEHDDIARLASLHTLPPDRVAAALEAEIDACLAAEEADSEYTAPEE